jgi:sugar phosphate isomerase/epimerase
LNVDLAFHTLHFSPMFGGAVPLLETLSAAHHAGFGYIGLDVPSIEAFVDQGASLDDLADALAAQHLTCTDIAVLALEGDGDAVAASARRIAEIASAVPTLFCVLAVRDRLEWNQLVSMARACGSTLAGVGVRFAVEFSTYTPLATLSDAVRLCEALGWDRAGVLIDTLQFFRARTGWHELATLEPSQVAMVQFCDAVATPAEDIVDDSRNRRLIPGEGELPLHQFVDAVRQIGFDGPVAAEVLSASVRTSEPHVITRDIYDALATYWSS